MFAKCEAKGEIRKTLFSIALGGIAGVVLSFFLGLALKSASSYPNLEKLLSPFLEKLKKLKKSSNAWIMRAPLRDQTKPVLAEWDTIVGSLSEKNRAILSEKFSKIIGPEAKTYEEAYDVRFLDTIMEMFKSGDNPHIFPD